MFIIMLVGLIDSFKKSEKYCCHSNLLMITTRILGVEVPTSESRGWGQGGERLDQTVKDEN